MNARRSPGGSSHRVRLPGFAAAERAAARHAERLLRATGLAVVESGSGGLASEPAAQSVRDWAASGAMSLCGWSGGPPSAAPAMLATAARGAALALGALSPALRALDGPALLGERAARLGLARRGDVAPGGAARLLRCADGWIALNLARPDDLALLPAWLGEGDCSDPWDFAAPRLAPLPVGQAVARGRLLGLPVAPAGAPARVPPPPFRLLTAGTPAPAPAVPLVVNLSSLWAGPLCAHLLQAAGARVVRVESLERPDGARAGEPGFFDLLHAGQESVALAFREPAGRRVLARLLAAADVVIEASRPRALSQLGIDAAALLRERPGKVWVSITGYGRREPGAGWVAFGDDAACAAGLAVLAGYGTAERRPVFCADAIADPLTGLYAVLAALGVARAGGGVLVDLSLSEVAAHAARAAPRSPAPPVEPQGDGWRVRSGGAWLRVAPARARPVTGRARELGADTVAVTRELVS